MCCRAAESIISCVVSLCPVCFKYSSQLPTMSDIVSATPVRSNLAQMLLQLKELPADMVSDSLNKFVALEKTPQFLKDIKEESTGSATATSSDNVRHHCNILFVDLSIFLEAVLESSC